MDSRGGFTVQVFKAHNVLSIPLNGFLATAISKGKHEVIVMPFNSIEWIQDGVLVYLYCPDVALSIPLNGFNFVTISKGVEELIFQFH